MYDNDCFVGNIMEKSEENHDVLVNFITKNQFKWPGRQDVCLVPSHLVLCCIDKPQSTGHGGHQYFLS